MRSPGWGSPPRAGRALGYCLRPNADAKLRLYCFPFAGVAPGTVFRSWVTDLPADLLRDVEMWAVDVRPPETAGQPLVTELGQLLDPLVTTDAPPVPPYAFFGHSMGALIGFELARRLRARSASEPAHLIVSGHRAPQLPRRQPPVHTLPEAGIVAKVRAWGGVTAEVSGDPELMRRFLPRLRADLAVCETYRHEAGEPLSCSLTALGGTEDPEVTRRDLLLWREQATGSFSMHVLPGGHFFLQKSPTLFLRVLTQDLRRVLRRIS